MDERLVAGRATDVAVVRINYVEDVYDEGENCKLRESSPEKDKNETPSVFSRGVA